MRRPHIRRRSAIRGSRRHVARRAGQVAGSVTESASSAVGTAAQRAGSTAQRAGSALELRGAAAAPAVGAAVGSAVGSTLQRADAVTASAVDAGQRVGAALGGAASGFGEVVSGLVEEPAVRGAAALDALRGARVGPPMAVRRWPWALGAAVLGAAAGAAVAHLVRRIEGEDAPGAQEPHELEAVVDLRTDSVEVTAPVEENPSPS
jgi:hypothetical protein